MFKKKKPEAEVVKEERTVRLQGRQVERLISYQNRLNQITEQLARLSLEKEKIDGCMEGIMNLHVEEGEKVVSYNFSKQDLLIEKIIKPDPPKPPKLPKKK